MGKKLALLLVILVAGIFMLGTIGKKPSIEAEFEVAGIADEEAIPFTVILKNVGEVQADDLTVVATAGDAIVELKLPLLEVGEEKSVSGELALEEGEGAVEFSARVLGDGVSFRSKSISVARVSGEIGGGELYSQIPQQQAIQQQVVIPPGPDQMGISPPGAELAVDERTFGTLEEVEPLEDVEHLISRVEDHQCKASEQTLEVYQNMGNTKADAFLVSKL